MSLLGLPLGAAMAALTLGLRHGVDWDHIAAIGDLTLSQESRRRGMVVSACYAVGHALVVLALGMAAIAFASTLPDWIDPIMTRFVGATLVVLGLAMAAAVWRGGMDTGLRSRWMVVADAVGHRRRERAALGAPSAVAIGAVHGIGAETPTQLLLFVSAARVGGTAPGIAMLVLFAVGLVVTNTAVASMGVLAKDRLAGRTRALTVFSLFYAAISVGLGLAMLLAPAGALPV